jgi:hypothetical protein
MNCRFPYLAVIISSVLAPRLRAQAAARPDPVGTWRGTSLCRVRPSACHDESVVYRITRTTTRDSLALDGRKLVNAAEVEMGVLGCQFEAPSARLTCPIPNGVWQFTIRGDSLVGELRLSDGTKARDVRTGRSR